MQSVDIALKNQGCFIYNMLREGVPKSNGTLKKNTMVIISGVRDKVRQGILFSSNCIYDIRYHVWHQNGITQHGSFWRIVYLNCHL